MTDQDERQPWDCLDAHLNGPDSLFCPSCRGDLETHDGEHLVVLNNGDNSYSRVFDDPHVAWSNFDSLRQSWTGAFMCHVEISDRPNDIARMY